MARTGRPGRQQRRGSQRGPRSASSSSAVRTARATSAARTSRRPESSDQHRHAVTGVDPAGLPRLLAERGLRIQALEVDPRLVARARQNLAKFPHVSDRATSFERGIPVARCSMSCSHETRFTGSTGPSLPQSRGGPEAARLSGSGLDSCGRPRGRRPVLVGCPRRLDHRGCQGRRPGDQTPEAGR